MKLTGVNKVTVKYRDLTVTYERVPGREAWRSPLAFILKPTSALEQHLMGCRECVREGDEMVCERDFRYHPW